MTCLQELRDAALTDTLDPTREARNSRPNPWNLHRAAPRIGIGVAVGRILSLPSSRRPNISLKVSSRCTVTIQTKSRIIVEHFTKHPTTCYQAVDNMLPITRNHFIVQTNKQGTGQLSLPTPQSPFSNVGIASAPSQGKHPTTCYQAVENMFLVTRNHFDCAIDCKAIILWCIGIVRLTCFSLAIPGKKQTPKDLIVNHHTCTINSKMNELKAFSAQRQDLVHRAHRAGWRSRDTRFFWTITTTSKTRSPTLWRLSMLPSCINFSKQ